MLRVNVQWSWKIDKCSTEGSWVPLIACKKRQEYITSLHYLCVILLRRSSCMLSTLLLFCLCRPPQRFSLPFDCWPNQIAHYILYTYSLSHTLTFPLYSNILLGWGLYWHPLYIYTFSSGPLPVWQCSNFLLWFTQTFQIAQQFLETLQNKSSLLWSELLLRRPGLVKKILISRLSLQWILKI